MTGCTIDDGDMHKLLEAAGAKMSEQPHTRNARTIGIKLYLDGGVECEFHTLSIEDAVGRVCSFLGHTIGDKRRHVTLEMNAHIAIAQPFTDGECFQTCWQDRSVMSLAPPSLQNRPACAPTWVNYSSADMWKWATRALTMFANVYEIQLRAHELNDRAVRTCQLKVGY